MTTPLRVTSNDDPASLRAPEPTWWVLECTHYGQRAKPAEPVICDVCGHLRRVVKPA